MALIKSWEDIKKIHSSGKLLANVVAAIVEEVRPGVKISQLNSQADELIRSLGGRPSFYQYQPSFATTPFPATICACVNEEIVHGFGTRDRVLKDGDIFSIDVGMEYKGFFSDMAVTVGVGKIAKTDQRLIKVTKRALELGMKAMYPGVSLAEIGRLIQNSVESSGFSVIRDLVGHGVGHAVHEEPAVLNYYDPNFKDYRLEVGMVLALEPMVAVGSFDVETLSDGWTVVTKDRSRSAHFEHTIAITKEGPQILTE